MPGGGRVRLRVSFAVLFCFIFLLAACAVKRVGMPTYEGVDVLTMLAGKETVKTIDSTFALEFERDGSFLRGDAVLRLTPDTLDLQVYSLGFLVAEVTANETVTRSNPVIDRSRLLMLVDGIRNSFFWWVVRNPTVKDDEEAYRVSNSWKRLYLNRKTLMPEKQVMELEDGRQLVVLYDEPVLMEGGWFPSKMRIELSHQSVNLKIKSLSVKP